MTASLIYHLCRADEWQTAQSAGFYGGSSQDKADGFIHFSTAAQIVESAARHRAGQDGLVLVEVAAPKLWPLLKWEKSRGDQLFPHLYGALDLMAVTRHVGLRLGPDGKHVFPDWGFGGQA